MSNIKAVDTTLLFHEGRWWLFAAVQNYDGGCPHSSLHIYWSYDLLHGDWYEHTMNPVVSDIKTARPAGNFFMKNEELYRVSQDCSVRYGFAINTLRVKSLTITEYSEELVEVFKPEWADNVWATHTYNHYEGLRVFDALESRVRIW